MHDRLTMKPAYALIPGDIFKPVREDGFTAQTATWAKLTDIEELDNLRTIRLHTAEHGALAIPRYHRCYVQPRGIWIEPVAIPELVELFSKESQIPDGGEDRP